MTWAGAHPPADPRAGASGVKVRARWRWRPSRATRHAVLWGAIVGAVGYAVGLVALSAVVVALAVATAVLLAARIDLEREPGVSLWSSAGRDGARGDVQSLAWGMVGRDGRAGDWAMRRLRQVAAGRLSRHGLRLDDDGQAAAVSALIGAAAHDTLTRRFPTPTLAEVRSCLDALDRIGPSPSSNPPSNLPSNLPRKAHP